MSRSDRLFGLIEALRRRNGPVSGTDLARETGVSLRTVYRDVAALRAMGADVEGEPGFGYVMKPGFLLPPLMFTKEELQALALGAQWVGRQTDDGLASAAQNVIGKIGSVLPPDLRSALTDDMFHVGRRDPRSETVDLALVRRALREQFKLSLDYRDTMGAQTRRLVWPLVLGFIEAKRFVAGWCELRQAFRTFRIDRMERVEMVEERYPGRRRDLVRQWRALADAGQPRST